MAEYTVSNEIELGEVVWHSGPGDTVRFLTGHYGRVVVKGSTVLFPQDRSVTIGQLIGSGTIAYATFREKKGSVFIYRKLLPFNLRVQPNEPYFHPSGVSVTLVGHDRQMGGPIGVDRTAQEQLPRAIVDIEVPRTEVFDFELLKPPKAEPGTDWSAHFREEEKVRILLKGQPEGLPFGDVEYSALWALNHFLRQYASVAKSKKIKGLSFAEFRDGRTLAFGPWSAGELSAETQVFIDEYHGVPLTEAEQQDLHVRCLSARDYSVSEYITFALEHLNYSMAAVGMAQLLEANGMNQDREWESLQRTPLTVDQRRHLAEIILCRNQIMHTSRCSVDRDTRRYFDAAERLFGVATISEYRIYATKLPWIWYRDGVLPYLSQSTGRSSGLESPLEPEGPGGQGEL